MSSADAPGQVSGSFEDLAADEPYEGVHRRRFDAHGATVAQYRFDPGARFPRHRHPEEQVTIVEEGEVTFVVGDSRHSLGPGGWSIVAPNDEHELIAGPDGARILAVIVPRRTGDVGYTLVEDG